MIMVIVGFIILGLVQVGVSLYVSFALLGVVSILIYDGKRVGAGLAINLPLRSFAVIMMLISLAASPPAEGVFLRLMRELIVMFIMTGFVTTLQAELKDSQKNKIVLIALAFSIFMLALSAIQYIAYQRQQYIGIPPGWFSLDSGTLPGEQDLIYSHLRPSGTYSEPSYLGFVMFALTIAISPMWKTSKASIGVTIIAVACVIISQSASGVFYFCLFFAVRLYNASPKVERLLGLGVVLISSAILTLNGSGFLGRLGDISDHAVESSGFDRIWAPIIGMAALLGSYPFGVSSIYLLSSGLDSGTSSSWGEILHNGLFNLFLNYGVGGLAIVAAMLATASASSSLLILLFAASQQNGAFLSVDKLYIVLAGACMFNSLRASRRKVEWPGPR